MSNELVPVDNMTALEGLDQQAREVAVTTMLTEARAWLAHAKEATEPQTIANFRAQMATVAEATKQLNLSKEIQLDAQEMVRRAERGVGKSVREGQAAGEIRANGQRQTTFSVGKSLSAVDLVGFGRPANETYRMTDDVTDEQFDAAISKAKEEGNLTRANVVRKVEEVQPVKKKSPRRALVDDARDMAEVLRKTTVRLEKFASDDRIPRNKAEVAARLRNHLDDALQICTDLRNMLDEQ